MCSFDINALWKINILPRYKLTLPISSFPEVLFVFRTIRIPQSIASCQLNKILTNALRCLDNTYFACIQSEFCIMYTNMGRNEQQHAYYLPVNINFLTSDAFSRFKDIILSAFLIVITNYIHNILQTSIGSKHIKCFFSLIFFFNNPVKKNTNRLF